MTNQQHRFCVICGSRSVKTRFRVPEFTVLQCGECDVIFKSDILEKTTADIQSVYDSDWYWQSNPNRQDGGVNYDPQHSKVKRYRRDLRILAGLLSGKKGRLLDVGCAKGVFLDVAHIEGWQSVGLEISSWASQYARDQFGLEVFTGTLTEAPWPDEDFDAITMWDLIEHLADPSETVAQASRLLRNGGVLAILTPDSGSFMFRGSELVFRLSGGLIKKPFYQVYEGGHIVFFNQDTLTHLLNRHGFQVLRIHRDSVDTGRWRSNTAFDRILGLADRVVGGILDAKYRMYVYARKTE